MARIQFGSATTYLTSKKNMSEITNDELIKKAEAVLNYKEVNGRLFGDVGAALVTDKGNVYTGVCIDTPSWGLCAERSAIAAMVTAKEFTIVKIVGVWKNENGTQVLPPCGLCREFMRQVNEDNLNADVILQGKVAKLKDLLPYHDWFGPMP
jgi:cytidine deaminase